MFQSSPGPKAGCYRLSGRVNDFIRGGFNPHPARRPGATLRVGYAISAAEIVSILTRPEGRVLRSRRWRSPSARTRFQSSPGPKAGCYLKAAKGSQFPLRVSILTRPEGRVLPLVLGGEAHRPGVSILTRPEGRVLLCGFTTNTEDDLFQSSPGPKAGCYISVPRNAAEINLFQSSPGPKAGCYKGSDGEAETDLVEVSILTRPEGRVLLLVGCEFSGRVRVSILTRPEGRVLPWRRGRGS